MCIVAVLWIFGGNRSSFFFLRCVSAKSSNIWSALVFARSEPTHVELFIFSLCSLMQLWSHMYVCVHDGGVRFGWMSHIVPARPGDMAGGQRGMGPERGDNDK